MSPVAWDTPILCTSAPTPTLALEGLDLMVLRLAQAGLRLTVEPRHELLPSSTLTMPEMGLSVTRQPELASNSWQSSCLSLSEVCHRVAMSPVRMAAGS